MMLFFYSEQTLHADRFGKERNIYTCNKYNITRARKRTIRFVFCFLTKQLFSLSSRETTIAAAPSESNLTEVKI